MTISDMDAKCIVSKSFVVQNIAAENITASNMKRRIKGFTLIEIMIVMVLLGLISSVAVFTLGSGKQQRELENESQRLHALLRMASEEAILSNTEIGFLISEDGYEFLEFDEEKEQWSASTVPLFKARTFPEWVVVVFQREGQDIRILGKEDGENKRPDMMLLSSGEVTPFSITLQVEKNSSGEFKILSDGIEEIKLLIPGKEEI